MRDFEDYRDIWKGEEASLPQMLDAREYRAYRQRELLKKYNLPLLCFTMNIAGPVKNNALVQKGFAYGLEDFKAELMRYGKKIVYEEILCSVTGMEGFFAVDMNGRKLKELTCMLEDRDDLGRLYDMDVLFPCEDGSIGKYDRTDLNKSARKCLICGKEGKMCSSRRIHPFHELQQKTAEILYDSVMTREAETIAQLGEQALLYEVCTTPKPGLVDRNNSGAHKDMDIFTFMKSSASLRPYFRRCAEIGLGTCEMPATEVFTALRQEGIRAEEEMLRATEGVNTHKGAIFTMGILCAAAGRRIASCIRTDSALCNTDAVFAVAAEMTAGLTEHDFAHVTADNAITAGEKLYACYGITGIRGQMEAGLPAVRKEGLPLLKKRLEEGKSEDEAGAEVLLKLISVTQDTNLIHRGSIEIQKVESERLGSLNDIDQDILLSLDQEYIERNLSPGGSADLLAACWFMYFMEKEQNRLCQIMQSQE